MSEQWRYVGEYETNHPRRGRLVAVFRTRRDPTTGVYSDQVYAAPGWKQTTTLMRNRAKGEENDFLDLTPAEAERLTVEIQQRREQTLARAVHTLVRGFTAGGFPDAAEQIRSAYADLRAGTAPAAALHDLLDPEILPANNTYPDDTDARLDFNRAWGMAQQLTRPAP